MRLEEQRIARGEAIQRQRRTIFTPGGEAETRQLIRNRLKEEEPRNQHYRQESKRQRSYTKTAVPRRRKAYESASYSEPAESGEYSLMAKTTVILALGAFLALIMA